MRKGGRREGKEVEHELKKRSGAKGVLGTDLFTYQVQFYRDHMKRNFQRVLAATELEFSDVAGRRQQAAWNLAKPPTVSFLK